MRKAAAPSAIVLRRGDTLILASYQGSNQRDWMEWQEASPGMYAAFSLLIPDEEGEVCEISAEGKKEMLSGSFRNMLLYIHPENAYMTAPSVLRRELAEEGVTGGYSAVFASKEGISFLEPGRAWERGDKRPWGILPSSSRMAEDCLEGALAQLKFYKGRTGENVTADELIAAAAYAVEGSPLTGYSSRPADKPWEPDATTRVTVVEHGKKAREYKGDELKKIVNRGLPDFSAMP